MTMAVEDEEEIAALSSKFECVKIAMNQDKTGFILKLSIHPNDAPEDLLRDVVGTRYLMVAVRVGEDDRPVPSQIKRNQDVALKIAHAISRDPRFQSWLMQKNMADEMSDIFTANRRRSPSGSDSARRAKTVSA